MKESPFKALAAKLSGGTSLAIAADGGHLTDVLSEHLDMIAAAHHSSHISSHDSQPNAREFD